MLGALMLSCKDENISIEKGNNTAEAAQSNYYKIYNSEAKNHLLIENLNGIYDKTNISNITSRSLDGNPMSLTFNGRTLSPQVNIVGKGGLWTASTADVKSLFGKKLFLQVVNNKLVATTNTGAAGKNAGDGLSVYIPEIINAEVSGLNNGSVAPGTVVTWNRDMNNVMGVSLMIEYNPFEQTMTGPYAGVNPNTQPFKSKYLEIEDVGSYTVTEEDLTSFPSGSNLSFYISRSAYAVGSDPTIGTMPGNDTSIGAVTATRADFQIKY
ncbi:hypothetical protein CIN01S_02_01050 [Chryseobacterium indologenes NBRC 14944]|nr:hypothetical protein CIN01S_02_01050 [Chryseobacterium indologenes NBRC 14944]